MNTPGRRALSQTSGYVAGDWGRSRALGGLLCFLSPQLALPHLWNSRGNAINISSLARAIGQSQTVPYVATKVGHQGTLLLPSLPTGPPGVSDKCLPRNNVVPPNVACRECTISPF